MFPSINAFEIFWGGHNQFVVIVGNILASFANELNTLRFCLAPFRAIHLRRDIYDSVRFFKRCKLSKIDFVE